MLKEFLNDIDLLELPIVAMLFFLVLFALVLVRVASRSRTPIYRRIARLPLDDDNERQNVAERSGS